MNNQVRSWALYDFANSLIAAVISFYFSLYFVDTLGLSDAWISLIAIGSTFTLLFILPQLGAMVDKNGAHKKYLTITSVLAAFATMGIGVSMSIFDEGSWLFLMFILLSYFLYHVLFQMAFALYTSFLKGISVGKEDEVAGLGNGLGQLGNIVGLVIGFFIVTQHITIGFLSPVGTLFIGNAIIFLCLYFWIQKGFPETVPKNNGAHIKVTLVSSLQKIYNNKNIYNYLISFLLYADSILTLNIFISLYIKKAGGLSDGSITTLGLVGLTTSMAGAFLTPWLNKKIGNQKRAIVTYIVLFGVLLVLFSLCTTYLHFFISLACSGLLFGLLFSTSISMYARLIPKHEEAEYFSFFVLFSRLAAMIGPLIWSLTAYMFASMGDDKYRASVIALSILVFLSLFFMRKVKLEYST